MKLVALLLDVELDTEDTPVRVVLRELGGEVVWVLEISRVELVLEEAPVDREELPTELASTGACVRLVLGDTVS